MVGVPFIFPYFPSGASRELPGSSWPTADISENGSQMSYRPLGTLPGLFWPRESVRRRNERGYNCFP